jgi:hypothetical protein
MAHFAPPVKMMEWIIRCFKGFYWRPFGFSLEEKPRIRDLNIKSYRLISGWKERKVVTSRE